MAFTPFHNIVASQNAAIIQMIANLVSEGWSVPDSGDGRSVFSTPASGIYGAGTNVITGSSSTAGYVANEINNYYSWTRLRPPTLSTNAPELVIQHTPSNPGAHTFAMSLILNPGPQIPWAGAASDNPGTPPDVWGPLVGNNQSMALPSNGTSLFYHSTGTLTLDMMVGDVDEGYAFYALLRSSLASFMSGIVYDYCQEADPEDTSPYVVFCNGNQTTPWGTTFLRDARGYWNAPNPTAPYGGYMKKDVDPGMTGIPYKLPSWATAMPGYGLSLPVLDVVNPYDGTTFDLLEGCVWVRATAGTGPYSHLYGRVKGRSSLIRALGPESGGTDGALGASRSLVCQGDGRYWLVWDGSTGFGSDVTVNLVPFVTVSDPMETTELLEDTVAERVYYAEVESTEFGGGGGTTTTYYQRVWDAVLGQWCYFTSSTINTSPGTSDTQPNNTGAISGHNVVRVIEG